MSKHLHPAAILLQVGAYIRNLAPIYMIVLIRFDESLPFAPIWNTLLLLVLFLLSIAVFSFMRWKRFTYSVEPDQLCIESGIWLRNRRYIPKERIQSVHELQDIGHRLFGLVKLQIETASGGDEHEAVLSAISKEEAAHVQRILSRRTTADARTDEPEAVHELAKPRLLIYAATSGGVGLVLSAVIGLYSEFDDYLRLPVQLSFFFERSAVFYVMGLLLIGLIVWLIGLLLVYQKYYGFRMVRLRDELIITRGLFEKQKVAIPLRRIQAVKIEENMVRQWFGFSTVHLLSAGSSEDEHEKFSYICFPLVKTQELPDLFRAFLPDYCLSDELVRLPRRARLRYVLRLALPAAAICLSAAYFVPAARYVMPALLLAACILGAWQYRDAGWHLEGQQLMICRRQLNRVTVLLKREHIQSLSVHRTVWQDYAALCTLKLHVKSGSLSAGFLVRDGDESLGALLRGWYSHRRILQHAADKPHARNLL